MKDGERIVAAMSFDPRVIGDVEEDPKNPDLCPETHGFAAASNGFALRFGLESFVEPSTRSGRRYARVTGGASIVDVVAMDGSEIILAVSRACRAMICAAEEVNYLSGPGKGVTLIRLASDDELLGFKASTGDRDLLTVKTNRGAKKTISTAKYRVTSRGGRGNEIQKNGQIAEIITPPPAAPEPLGEPT
jgi:DNA gyrase subunit A